MWGDSPKRGVHGGAERLPCQANGNPRSGCTFIPCARLIFRADKVNQLEGGYTLLPAVFRVAAASVGLLCGMDWGVVL